MSENTRPSAMTATEKSAHAMAIGNLPANCLG